MPEERVICRPGCAMHEKDWPKPGATDSAPTADSRGAWRVVLGPQGRCMLEPACENPPAHARPVTLQRWARDVWDVGDTAGLGGQRETEA